MAIYLPPLGGDFIGLSILNENGEEEGVGEQTTVLSTLGEDEAGGIRRGLLTGDVGSVPPPVDSPQLLGLWATLLRRQQNVCSFFSQCAGDSSLSLAARVRSFCFGWPSLLLRVFLSLGHALLMTLMGIGDEKFGLIFLFLLILTVYFFIFTIALSTIYLNLAVGFGVASAVCLFSGLFLFCCHCRCRCAE